MQFQKAFIPSTEGIVEIPIYICIFLYIFGLIIIQLVKLFRKIFLGSLKIYIWILQDLERDPQLFLLQLVLKDLQRTCIILQRPLKNLPTSCKFLWDPINILILRLLEDLAILILCTWSYKGTTKNPVNGIVQNLVKVQQDYCHLVSQLTSCGSLKHPKTSYRIM